MTQNLESPPEGGTPLEGFRADQKAEKRWRQHEVQARINKLERKLNEIAPRLDRLFDMVEAMMPKQIVDTTESPKELSEGDEPKG